MDNLGNIIGRTISGLAVKAIGAGLALYVGFQAYAFVTAAFATIPTLPLN